MIEPAGIILDLWTGKDAAPILGTEYPSKVSQMMNPAFEKIAKLMLADPFRTLCGLVVWMIHVRTTQRIQRRLQPDRGARIL